MSTATMLTISEPSVFIPSFLGKLRLLHEKDRFYILQNGTRHSVHGHDIDPLLRNLTRECLVKFLANGYISVNQLDDKAFCLRANVRGPGGGEITGKIASWAVTSLGYGLVGICTIVRDAERRSGHAPNLTDLAGPSFANPTTHRVIENASKMAEEYFTAVQWLP